MYLWLKSEKRFAIVRIWHGPSSWSSCCWMFSRTALQRKRVSAAAPEQQTRQRSFSLMIFRYTLFAMRVSEDVRESAHTRIPSAYLKPIIVVPIETGFVTSAIEVCGVDFSGRPLSR